VGGAVKGGGSLLCQKRGLGRVAELKETIREVRPCRQKGVS